MKQILVRFRRNANAVMAVDAAAVDTASAHAAHPPEDKPARWEEVLSLVDEGRQRHPDEVAGGHRSAS